MSATSLEGAAAAAAAAADARVAVIAGAEGVPGVVGPARAGAPARERLAAIDGLRAVAAISVLFYHVARATGATETGLLDAVISQMKAGVTVFFVISGFVLYLPYARAIRDADELPNWRDFAWRRAARILPAYWVVLTVLALGPLQSTIAASDGWRFYCFGQIYSGTTMLRGLGVAWSLCIEVSFYMVLPLLAAAIAWLARARRGDGGRTQLAVIALIAFGCLALRAGIAGSLLGPISREPNPAAGSASLATSLPGLLDWFALGMALAVMRSGWESGRGGRLRRLAEQPTLCWVCAGAFYAIGVPLQQGNLFLPFYGLGTHVAIGLCSFALVLPALAPSPAAGPTSTTARWTPLVLLRHPAVVWLGTISYGIYLWHKPVLDAFNGPMPNVIARPLGLHTFALFALVLAGAVALGAASHYLIERPAQRRASSFLAAAR